MTYPNANRRVSFECHWASGCSDSARCNAHGSCVACAQAAAFGKPEPRDITVQVNIANEAAKRFEPGTQPDIRGLMISAYAHGYRQALLDFAVTVGKATDG